MSGFCVQMTSLGESPIPAKIVITGAAGQVVMPTPCLGVTTVPQRGVLVVEVGRVPVGTSKIPAPHVLSVAAGRLENQIAYSLVFMIARGEMLGRRPVFIHLLDLPGMETKLEAVQMELEDSASPLVAGMRFSWATMLCFV